MRRGEDGKRSLAALSFNLGRYGEVGTAGKKKTDSEVAAVLLCRVIKEEAPILVDDVFQEGSKTENALH